MKKRFTLVDFKVKSFCPKDKNSPLNLKGGTGIEGVATECFPNTCITKDHIFCC